MSKNENPKKLLEKKNEIRTTRGVPLFANIFQKIAKMPTICSTSVFKFPK
jgi:hypothetical protein